MLTIGVTGDFGVYCDNSVRVANLVKSWNPQFVVSTGDNLYTNSDPTEKAYSCVVGELYKEYLPDHKKNLTATNKGQLILQDKTHNSVLLPPDFRFLPCVGNWDYPTEAYCNYFGLPTYYGIEFKSDANLLKLISLNNYMDVDGNFECEKKRPTVQKKWLEEELERSAHIKWVIVYFHYPQICSKSPLEENYLENKFPFHKYPNVALVLSGHKHVYERLNVQGVANVVVGTGGHSLYNEPVKLRPESIFYDHSGYGGLKLEIDYEQINGSYYVIDKDNNYVLKDGFVVVQRTRIE